MAKYYRGDVVLAMAPIGDNKFKIRPVVILKDVKKSDNFISVYCTTQNNGEDEFNIFVEADSEHGEAMGLEEDTYIRPKRTLNLSILSIQRFIGTCPLMHKIDQIQENIKAGL
jgi:hypothetical protein